jgi:hypothetical protein
MSTEMVKPRVSQWYLPSRWLACVQVLQGRFMRAAAAPSAHNNLT